MKGATTMARTNKKSAVITATATPTFREFLEVERSSVVLLTDQAGKWYRRHLTDQPEQLTAREALRLYGELEGAAYTLDLGTQFDRNELRRLINEALAEAA